MKPRQRPRLALIGTEKLPTPPIQGGAIQTYIAGVIPHLARQYELTVVGPARVADDLLAVFAAAAADAPRLSSEKERHERWPSGAAGAAAEAEA